MKMKKVKKIRMMRAKLYKTDIYLIQSLQYCQDVSIIACDHLRLSKKKNVDISVFLLKMITTQTAQGHPKDIPRMSRIDFNDILWIF